MLNSKLQVYPIVNLKLIDRGVQYADHKQMVDKTPYQLRFDAALTELKIPNLSAFADLVGVSKQVVNNWYNRDGRIGGRKRSEVQARTGISVDWINDGTGEMLLTRSPATSPDEMGDGYIRFLLLDGAGGMGAGIANSDYPEAVRDIAVAEWEVRRKLGFIPSPGRIQLLTGRGPSMRPTIDNGDVVMVDTMVTYFDGDAVYVVNIGGETQIKMLQMRADGLHVVSANSDYPPYRIDAENVFIGGKVVSVLGIKSI